MTTEYEKQKEVESARRVISWCFAARWRAAPFSDQKSLWTLCFTYR
ncbi:hypothetical protein CLOSTMETH_03323 [[Clostridium] methylpentosum DSM 5476]|uniref:Uncharacterized protein n=1 Tax=[Clostridium] methylpentosum DSM 5476 TaxID=537013 RepID=C0EHC3_9FIRM|nr:hypothetical protein CLOSTMETH_03323 [[Clostridium] methylpentosum DSM 5476]